MKRIITHICIFLLLFILASCLNDVGYECSAYNYSTSNFAGKYKAESIVSHEFCLSDLSNQSIVTNDSLDYILRLNEDGTGQISGTDTLTNLKWFVENINSQFGEGSSGCSNRLRVWTQSQQIEFELLVYDNNSGLDLIRQDSSWNFFDCARETTFSFTRIK